TGIDSCGSNLPTILNRTGRSKKCIGFCKMPRPSSNCIKDCIRCVKSTKNQLRVGWFLLSLPGAIAALAGTSPAGALPPPPPQGQYQVLNPKAAGPTAFDYSQLEAKVSTGPTPNYVLATWQNTQQNTNDLHAALEQMEKAIENALQATTNPQVHAG